MYKFKDNFIMSLFLASIITISVDISKPQTWDIINKWAYMGIGVLSFLIILYAADFKYKK